MADPLTTRGDIRITERDGVRTMRIGRVEQSSMRLDDPFHTDFAYPKYLHVTIAVVPEPKRALMIGVGGATVIKQLWRDHPALHIDAVELDADVAALAASHFELPRDGRVTVTIDDGRAFLEASTETYDIIIVDAFQDERVPLPLQTEQFAGAAAAHLSEGGVLAYNFHGSVMGDRSKPFRSLYRTLGNTFRRVWVFPVGLSAGGSVGAHREIILLASDANLRPDQLIARIESRVDGRVTVEGFEDLSDDLFAGGIRSGDVAILTDPPRR